MKDFVLYIDDEKQNLESFQLAFWSFYNILLAENTIEAEKLLKENDVKVIITDQKMADETGIQFIERIKDQYPEVIFIVLTAYAELDIVLDAINTGVYQFIQKPWEEKVLKQVIGNAIDKYNLQKQNKELLSELKIKNTELKDSNDELLSLARQYRERKRKSEDNEKLLNAIFKNLPLILLLVNSEREVLKINDTGLEAAEKEEKEALGLKGGDVLNCMHSTENAGCGLSESCKDCLIKKTIEDSFKYKTDYHKIDAVLPIKRKEKIAEHKIHITTTYIEGLEPLVLLSIDDISANNEVIALK